MKVNSCTKITGMKNLSTLPYKSERNWEKFASFIGS